jgi:uncharacterized protein YjbJ (UPF0337 family)
MKIASWGIARELGGKIQEGVGCSTGNVRTQAEGMANQVAGAVQDFYGQAAEATRAGAFKLDRWVRNAIETSPTGVRWLRWG